MADEDDDDADSGGGAAFESLFQGGDGGAGFGLDLGDGPGGLGGNGLGGLNSLKVEYGVIPTLYTGSGFGQSIGAGLDASVAPYVGRPYVWGGKSAAGPGFDCSGLVCQAVMPVLQAVNQQTNSQVYDIARMQQMLNQPAADQIQSIAAATDGGFMLNASNVNQLKPGMLLGITRKQIPGFAQGRYQGISHIGVICIRNGQMYVAQSASNGVGYTPLNKWLSDPSIASVHAVDPFAVTNSQGRQVIAQTFGTDPQQTMVADNTTKPPVPHAAKVKDTGTMQTAMGRAPTIAPTFSPSSALG